MKIYKHLSLATLLTINTSLLGMFRRPLIYAATQLLLPIPNAQTVNTLADQPYTVTNSNVRFKSQKVKPTVESFPITEYLLLALTQDALNTNSSQKVYLYLTHTYSSNYELIIAKSFLKKTIAEEKKLLKKDPHPMAEKEALRRIYMVQKLFGLLDSHKTPLSSQSMMQTPKK